MPSLLAVILLAVVTVTGGIPVRCLVCCADCQHEAPAVSAPPGCAQVAPASPRVAPSVPQPPVEVAAGAVTFLAPVPASLSACPASSRGQQVAASPPPPLVLRV